MPKPVETCFSGSRRDQGPGSHQHSFLLEPQMADGMLVPPCSLACLLPHSSTIMLLQKLELSPALTRHSRAGKAEGKLARWEPLGAIYFMLAPAAWRILGKRAARPQQMTGKRWRRRLRRGSTAPLAKSQRHLRLHLT